MEENVALDSTKQKKFVKSIKGIKKLIKKNEGEKSEKVASPKPKFRKRRSKRPDRGLVYLSHIPHGFYEHEMTQYFKQFGLVTNARVIRSKRTGNSKGFAFVEFKEPAVAEIVAETMNNYLMGKRLIKAAYVPPEKQKRRAMRKHWSRLNNPGRDARLKNKKAYNLNKDDKGDLKRARKILSNINKTKKKLSELGIDYSFFTPVDIPEALQVNEAEENSNTVKGEKESKKDKKAQIVESKDKKEPLKKENGVAKDIKAENNKKSVKAEPKKDVKNNGKKSDNIKKENKVTQEPVVNQKQQKQKQKKLKDAGVKPPESFIKVQEDPEDSDSSLGFDSDEYEKMLEDDGSDIDSADDSEGDDEDDGDESDADGDASSEEDDDAGSEDDGESEVDDDEEITPLPKKGKGKPVPIVAKPQKQANKQKGPAPEQIKRKAPQKPPVAAKKPKFEKQTQKPMKKQFKKKK